MRLQQQLGRWSLVALGLALAMQGSTSWAQRPRYAPPVQYGVPQQYGPPVQYAPQVQVGIPVGGAVAGPAQIVFGGRAQTDMLANQLYNQVNTICLEMYNNHQPNPQFQEMYREMYSVQQAAGRIRELTRQGYHRGRNQDDRIERELYDMERIIVNVEQELRTWRAVDRNPRDRELIPQQLNLVLSTLQEMMDDYGVRPRLLKGAVVVQSQIIQPQVIQPQVVVPTATYPYRGGYR